MLLALDLSQLVVETRDRLFDLFPGSHVIGNGAGLYDLGEFVDNGIDVFSSPREAISLGF